MYNPSKYKQGQEISPIPEIEVSPTLFSLLFPPQPSFINKTPLKAVQSKCEVQLESSIPHWACVKVEIRLETPSFTRLPSLDFVRARLDGLAFSNGSTIPVKYGTGEIIQLTLHCEGETANERGILSDTTLLQFLSSPTSPSETDPLARLHQRDPTSFYVKEAEQLEYLLRQARSRQHTPALVLLLHGSSGTGKSHLVKQLGRDMDFQVVSITSSDILDAKVTNPFERSLRHHLHLRSSLDAYDSPSKSLTEKLDAKDVILFFDDVEILLTSDEISDLESQRKCKLQFASMIELLHSLVPSSINTVLVVGCTNALSSLDSSTRRLFEREILIESLTMKERVRCMNALLRDFTLSPDTLYHRTAIFESCHGYSVSDMDNMIRTAAVLAELRVAELDSDDDTVSIDLTASSDSDSETVEKNEAPSKVKPPMQTCFITLEDLKEAKRRTRPEALKSDLQFVPSSSLVHFDPRQMAGLEKQYSQLVQSTVWMYKYKAQFKRMGIEPTRGTLLYGPPGTGKTMLAKAVASESQANFLAVSISDLIKGEIGASEEAIAELFRKARSMSPSIIFLDEVQAMFGSRDSSGHHGKNMISQLLLEMDGLSQAHDVAVIAATNRPDWIDPGLLRPGRFDRCLYIPPPPETAREHILRHSFSKLRTESDSFNEAFYQQLAKKTTNFTGADLANLCMKAAWNAVKHSTLSLESSPTDFVTQAHVLAALKDFSPTVTKSMLALYEGFQDAYGRAQLQERAQVNTIPTAKPIGEPPMSRMEQFRLERSSLMRDRRH
jgi:transitional endoplasmic reticulum ATPase